MSVDGKRVWVTEYIQCTTECGLEAGDQSAARLAQLIIGYVGGCVHAEGSARELILYTTYISLNTFSIHLFGNTNSECQFPTARRQSSVSRQSTVNSDCCGRALRLWDG